MTTMLTPGASDRIETTNSDELPFEPEYGDRFIEADTSDGYLVIPLRDLPAGSLVTISIRVGPEPVEAPAPVGEVTPTPKRYMGGPRING